METPDTGTLKEVIRLMKPQNDHEKFETLNSVAKPLRLKVNFKQIEFDEKDFLSPIPILFNHIRSTLVYKGCLYIHCVNGNLHILDLEDKSHLVKVIEQSPGLWNLFVWTVQLKAAAFWGKLKKRSKSPEIFSFDELLAYLDTLPQQAGTPGSETGDLLAGTVDGKEKEKLLGSEGTASFEITVKSGSFICLLDRDNKVHKLFRVRE